VTGKPITIYGDGKQVRDILYVDDLIDLYEAAIAQIDRVAGNIFNAGGGPANTLSIWAEFGPLLEERLGREIEVGRWNWRPGDQRVAVLDVRKAKEMLGWSPKVSPAESVRRLYDWVIQNRNLFD
jgi:CDP-paratose 2-epimerase